MFGLDAGPVIDDAQLIVQSGAVDLHQAHIDAFAGGAIFYGVFDKVFGHLVKLPSIACHHRRLGRQVENDLELGRLGQALQAFPHFPQEPRKIHGAGGPDMLVHLDPR